MPIRVAVCCGCGDLDLNYNWHSYARGEVTIPAGGSWRAVEAPRVLRIWLSIHANGRPVWPQGSEHYSFRADRTGRDEQGRPYLLLPPEMAKTLLNGYYGRYSKDRIGFATEGGPETLTGAIKNGWDHEFFNAFEAKGSIYQLGKGNYVFTYR
jgi:hypothetical protein